MKTFPSAFVALITAGALAFAPLSARADSAPSVGVSVSSLGIGLTAAAPIDNGIDIRATTGSHSFSQNEAIDGTGFTSAGKLSNLLLDAEANVKNTPFSISLGVLFNNDSVTNPSFSVKPGSVDPYVGIGYGAADGSGIGAMAGFVFQGSAAVNNNTTGFADQDVATGVGYHATLPILGVRYGFKL